MKEMLKKTKISRPYYALVRLTAIVAVVLQLVGCGSDDIAESPATISTDEGQAITFSGELGQAQSVTRATPLADGGQTTTFRIYGYKNDSYDAVTDSYTSYQTVMNGYRVVWEPSTGNAQGGSWEYAGKGAGAYDQTMKYWDLAASAYRFVAYAPADAIGVSYSLGGTPVVGTLSVNVDATAEDDIPLIAEWWMSTGNTTVYPDKPFGRPVTMTFHKPLSRVRFMFTFGEGAAETTRADLSDISLRPTDPTRQIARRGTVSLSYPITGSQTTYTWTATAATGTEAAALTAFTEDYTEQNPRWYTVLPQPSQGTYTLRVNVAGGERTAEVPATMTRWLPGYDYTYIFKITEAGGVVLSLLQMGMRDWTNGTTQNHEVYNW